MEFNWNDIKNDPNLLVHIVQRRNPSNTEAIVSLLHSHQLTAFSNLAKSIHRYNPLFESNTPDIILDAFHDGIMKVIAHIESNQIQTITVSIGTLIHKYCLLQLKSKLQDLTRKNNHLRVASLNEDLEVPSPQSEHKELEAKLDIFKKYFKQLGERCQELIRFRKLSSLSTEQIAEKMNLSVSSVNNEAFKCFNKLKELIYQSNDYKTLYHG